MDTKALRQKILDLAIHGKLVPQDPNDEPASVLLERIRAEKERLIKEGKIKKGKKSAKTSDKPHYPYELPKGWVWCKLDDIAYVGTGATPLTACKYYYENGNIAWINSSSTKVPFIAKASNFITQKAIEETNCLVYPKGTLVIAMYGEGKTRGQISELLIDAATNQACAAVRPYSEATKKYLKLFFEGNYLHIRALAEGGNQQNLSVGKIQNYEIPLPPLDEQKRILDKAKELLLQIDNIEVGKSVCQKYINQAKSKVLDLAIHGKLVSQDPNDEPASELLKRINPKAEITCDTPQYGKLPFVIPSSWEWVKLSGIAKSNIGLTYRPTDIVSTGVPVYRSNNIRNGKIDTTDLVKVSTKILEKQLLHVGDLLICARNGSRNLIGKNAIISELKEPTSFGAFMAVCRSAYNQWIRIVLNSEYFDRYLDDSNSATINQVTQKMLLALPIPLPPHQEQHRIVAKIEELFAQLDKIEASL